MRGPSICTVDGVGLVVTVCGSCTMEGFVATIVVDAVPPPAGNNRIIFLGICCRTGDDLFPIVCNCGCCCCCSSGTIKPPAVAAPDPDGEAVCDGELITMGFLIASFLLGVAATCTVCRPLGVDTKIGVVFRVGLKLCPNCC